MKNTDYIFTYWREASRKVFFVSLRPRRWRGKQSNFLNIFLVDIGLVMILALGLTSTGFSQAVNKTTKEAKGGSSSEIKEIEGEVSAVGKDYIAVVYNRDKEKGSEYEILLPIDKNIKLVHKQSLKQISIGDRVHVEYEELTEDFKEGPKTTFKGNIITFIKPAEKGLYTIEQEEEEFLFKGIK